MLRAWTLLMFPSDHSRKVRDLAGEARAVEGAAAAGRERG